MDQATKILLLIAVLVGAGFADHAENAANPLEGICSGEQACFSKPDNCTDPICDLILSLGSNVSYLYIHDIQENEMLHIYMYENGVQNDRIRVFLGNNPFTFDGIEPYGKEYRLTHKRFRVNVTVIDDDYDQYLYTYPGLMLKLGENVSYAYRKYRPQEGLQPVSTERIPLHFVESSKKPVGFIDHDMSFPPTTPLPKTEVRMPVEFSDRKLRFKKDSSVKTVDINFVLNDRMNF
ncbi:hypothetical protein GCK72_025743 [Caenorhabditis remanei]|uniref:Uncharacterized protein n=1 Tax=Caenorhabditis remanei TaxID=31234 RepID=A0A6A5G307_CAERE|nr:hypothetical protein GCK72_025743 [Caenorhabditis remanei]KAF1749276.1 hypothetical protein GCK72_025743 [Caenorhabditis remanei]